MASIDALRKRIRQADSAYRAGTPLMSDAQFDLLLGELRKLAPFAPELSTPGGGTALLSLDVAADAESAVDWYGSMPSRTIIIQPKIDGVAFAVRYRNGALDAAWTRSGRSALQLALDLGQLPRRTSGGQRNCVVYGELWSDDHKQATPAAALRRTAVSARGLNFTAYRLSSVEGASLYADELSSLDALSDAGFDTPTTYVASDAAQLLSAWNAWRGFGPEVATWDATKRRYPTDGLVAKLLDHRLQRTLGCTTVAPLWALALK